MKTLDSIQKTCKVFKVLAKVAMILSFVGAGLALVGLLCCAAWHTGGNVMGVSMEDALKLTRTGELNGMTGTLLIDFVFTMTDGVLFFFAYRCLGREVTDGTPFTTAGAQRVKSLGIKTIVMPLVAVIVSAVIGECFGLPPAADWDNGSSLTLGIALILFSLILRHGAELREENAKAPDAMER